MFTVVSKKIFLFLVRSAAPAGQSSEYDTAAAPVKGRRPGRRSVGAEVERRALVRGIRRGLEVGLELARGDLGGLARLQIADEFGRRAAHDALRNHGVMVLDVSCDQLAASLVEKYLAVKRDGLL